MGRVSKTTQALYNGVSQQAAGLRLDSQVEEMVNMWPDVARGVHRRTPTTHVSAPSWRIQDAVAGGVLKHYSHKIDKSLDERYIVHFNTDYAGTGTRIDAVDLDGNELPVIYDTTAVQDYIRSSPNTYGAGGHMRAVSVLDTTFLVNTSVTPAMTDALSQWGIDLAQDKYKWTASGFGTNEYYVNLLTGVNQDTDDDGTPDALEFDPEVSRPEEVLEDSTQMPEGTLGSLAVGEWAYGNNDGLLRADGVTPYSTIYVRLTDEVNPDTKADGYVFAKPTTEVAFLEYSDGQRNDVSVEIDGDGASRYPSGGKSTQMSERAYTIVNSDIAGGAKATYVGTGNRGRILRVTKETGGANVPFSITITPQPNAKLIVKEVDKFSDLPISADDGDILEVRGEAAESNSSSYYVRFDASTNRWVETLPDGLAYEIDPTTMPHKMTRLQDDGAGTVTGTPDQLYFFVEAIDWTDRAVGDNDSNPLPSFIGTPIEDIFFYQDRLGFASGENVVMSQTKEYFNFFAQTTTDVIDDDPIDVTIGTNSAVTVKWVFPFTNSLELIGTNRQFSLHSGTSSPALTPSNVVIDPTTSLEPKDGVRPAEMNNSLFIVTSSRRFIDVHRYQVDPEGINTRSFSLTRHIPEYIPDIPVDNATGVGAPTVSIRANEDAQALFLVNTGYSGIHSSPTHQHTAQVYVYNMLEQGNELVQSAWHRWTLPALSLETFGSDLYLFCARVESSSGNFNDHHWDTHMERMSLAKDAHTSAKDRYLDDLEACTLATYSTYQTDWDVPQTVNGVDCKLTVTTGDDSFDSYRTGYASRVYVGPHYTYTLSLGLGTNGPDDWVGFAYESYVELSEVILKGEQGIKVGRLIHLATQAHVETGDIVTMKVYSKSRQEDLTERSFTTGLNSKFRELNPAISVHLNSQDALVTLTSLESIYPLNVQGISWVANYINHSRTL